MSKYLLPLFFLLNPILSEAQLNPAITCWKVNGTGATGFGGYQTNVQQVQYSTNNVYISTTDIADWIPIGYDWPNNPWFAEAQNFVFKITLSPQEKPSNKTETGYGHIGLWTNGVSIYNPKDAKSYLDSSVWFQNAFFFEHLDIETMDSCFGHPNGLHEYHLHVHPACLWNETDSTNHAPLLGYAFDGFPIYGCYAYANTNGTGAIKRLKSSYRLRSISDRTTLPDGTVLTPPYYGPSLLSFPLGAYMEDYEFVQGLGDLDEHNGRFCVTPEYPNGIYAYFVTIDYSNAGNSVPVFPYVLGKTFYGVLQPGNMGPNTGHNTITETVTVYTSASDPQNDLQYALYPNPSSSALHFFAAASYHSNMQVRLFNNMGQEVKRIENIQAAVAYQFDVADLAEGIYVMRIEAGDKKSISKILIVR